MLASTSRQILVRSARRRIPSMMVSAPSTIVGDKICSSASFSTSYAMVRHADEYENEISGSHGQQLQLAYKEGEGKDEPPFDPFLIDDDEEEEEIYDSDDDDMEESDDLEPMQEEEWDDEEEENDMQVLYNNDGSLVRPKSEMVALRAGLPAGGLFAIVNIHKSQQKVTVDDVVIVDKLLPVSKYAVGTTHTVTDTDVLMLGSSHFTLVGMPGVPGAQVDFMVEEITRDKTVIVFKKRRRKHSKRKNGFRREVTFLRILDIRVPEQYNNLEYKGK